MPHTAMTSQAAAETPTQADPEPAADQLLVETLHRWTQSRVGIEERLGAIAGELEQTSAALVEARKAAILGGADSDSEAIGQLVGRQRALEAERDELLERFEVAQVEEQKAQRAAGQAKVTRNAAKFDRKVGDLVDAAAASDAELDTLTRSLRDALVTRWQLDHTASELVLTAEQTRQQHVQAGYDVPPGRRLDVNAIHFDPRRIPALSEQDARSRYEVTV